MIPRDIREHPAPQPAAGQRGGGYTRNFLADGEQSFIYDASAAYQAAGIPLVILAGAEYGSGSSRDWAAKGTALLGVKAVIAVSYERIHRSNLIGMGVIPLQFPAGQTADTLGLTGTETFAISGITALNEGSTPKTVTVTATPQSGDAITFEAKVPDRHAAVGPSLLPQRRDHAVRAAEPARGIEVSGEECPGSARTISRHAVSRSSTEPVTRSRGTGTRVRRCGFSRRKSG